VEDSDRLPRKLAAILYADVAEYARLTGEDEDATHRRLSGYLDLISSTVEQHHGRVMHYAGDAVLAMFDAVVEALACAAQIQRELKSRNDDLPGERKVQFRIGVNMGDVIEDRGDIYGDGVNVAARLETLAEPGGICISDSVHTAVGNKLPLGYEFLGEQQVKNIAKPIATYRVVLDSREQSLATDRESNAGRARPRLIAAAMLAVLIAVAWWIGWQRPWEPDQVISSESGANRLPEKPSIAVLPFSNMSDDTAQEYFADGITEDLITDLSKLSGLLVIARNSTFAYKGKQVDVRQVADDLGVRYVLEGSVRRAGDQVRINAQLVDASTGGHLWAERYDGSLPDVFALQDNITEKIVTALAVKLSPTEEAVLNARGTSNAEAYDAVLRGIRHLNGVDRWHQEENVKAREEFEKAIQLDAGYARAHAGLGWTHWFDYMLFNMSSTDKGLALTLADQSIELGNNPLARRLKAVLYLELDLTGTTRRRGALREYELAVAEMEEAVALEPGNADSLAQLAYTMVWAGNSDQAAKLMQEAMRLNPNFPNWYHQPAGISSFLLKDYERAIKDFTAWFESDGVPQRSTLWLASAQALAGREVEAKKTIGQWPLRFTINPYYAPTLRSVRSYFPFKQQEHLDLVLEGLRRAGVPEDIE
jgi:TolB-like protein/class 3 adenylate cyclase